jgi:hypothetical protein
MKLLFLFIGIGIFISACHGPVPANREAKEDSAEIVKLLKDVYSWHDKNPDSIRYDFCIIVKDSFQVGVNYDSLKKTINVLNQTGYFSSNFMENYKNLAKLINKKLTSANPKMYNEINFSFQDADPWTGFQDSDPGYWNEMKVSGYKATADSASLKWKLQTPTWSSDPYTVGFSFEKGKWRVSYLEGFDAKNF